MTDSTAFSVEDMKRKIMGLLAKAEGTDNEAEQKAFSEKAEVLMIRLGITAAEMESQGVILPENIIEVRRRWTTIYAPAMATFAFRVGTSYGNLNLLQSRFSKDSVTTYIIGHKTDVEQFEVLLTSLHLQVFSALKAFRKENRDNRHWNTIHENFVTDRSFVEGYGEAVARRLRDLRHKEEKTASTGASLVLVNKKGRVDEWTGAKYPSIRPGRASNRQHSYTGREAGGRAGQQANLGSKGVGGNKGQIR